MTRRGGQLPWNSGSRGLYDSPRRGGYGQLAVLGLIVLGVAALSWFLFTRACASDECTKAYCVSNKSVSPPEGYELVTRLFEYSEKSGAKAGPDLNLVIQLPLTKPTTDSSNLSFYRYIEDTGNWEPITAAVVDGQGKQASATLTETPQLMAVLRRNTPGGQLVAYLGHNNNLHPDSADKVTLVHTLDFAPAADGSVVGEPSAIKPGTSYDWYPTITANASTKGALAIVDGILVNAQSRSNHVQQVTRKVLDLNLKGIDIAYLDLNVNQRNSFTLFVSELAASLHAQNRRLTLTLPTPLKVADRIDEGAYDYAELGKSADLIKLTPYRDQGTYRLAMPEILAYLTASIPASKLVLTVTPYATEKGASGLSTLKVTDAMSIATKLAIRSESVQTSSNVDVYGINIDRTENLSGVRWVPEAASVAFTYKEPGGAGNRTIWIENVFSVAFKLEFASQFKLGGVAVEDASDNQFLGNIWPAIIPFASSGQTTLLQPNPEDLKPVWRASKGQLEDSGKGYTRWVTPAEPGMYTIFLQLSDGVARFENKAEVNVKAREARTPTSTGTPQAGATPIG
ncbi:MAG: hypothetical protein C0506_11870 [Anaerolinea sp.]|nr:hypothetical protein [Anaerolinea sp.]